MRVFLYEFVTGGGFLGVDGAPVPDGSLLREGTAMWTAIHADLKAISGVCVTSMRDGRLLGAGGGEENVAALDLFGSDCVEDAKTERTRFTEHAREADFTLLIAPETDGHLLDRTRQVSGLRCVLLSPNARFVELTSDKTKLADLLTRAGIATPAGRKVEPGDPLPNDFPRPAVWKLNDGAGSACQVLDSLPQCRHDHVMRIEQFVEGLNCSISFLCRGEKTPIACPPMEQILSSSNPIEYLGGARVMNSDLVERATRLGVQTLSALPPAIGYIGIDLVLGKDGAGSEDYVIEVNPRLTTSYVGLRKIAKANLAKAMIEIATNETPNVPFSAEPVNFLSDGTTR